MESEYRRAQKLLINYLMRFIYKWCPKGADGFQASWRRGKKLYSVTVHIATNKGGSDDLQ